MNYVDGGYVVDELADIHTKGYDIEIDWLARRFEPRSMASSRLRKSIDSYCDALNRRLASQNVDLEKLESLTLRWPTRGRKFMFATDDRGQEYKIYINEIK